MVCAVRRMDGRRIVAAVEVRTARRGDLEVILEVYNHYVGNSVATFDERPVSVESRVPWFESFDSRGPHRLLVADGGGADGICGYACSSRYRPHASFSETVELTVYVSPTHTAQGVGTSLYERLLEELNGEPVHRAVVGIALPNDASVQLHRRFGFSEIGVFDEYAKKWGRYISSVWMQRAL